MSDTRIIPKRAWALAALASLACLGLLLAINAYVNAPLQRALEHALGAQDPGQANAYLLAVFVRFVALFIEFSLAMWLIYRIILPRVLPETELRVAEDRGANSKEELMFILLIVVIVLFITK